MADIPDDGAAADVVLDDKWVDAPYLEYEALVKRIEQLRLVPKFLDLSRALTVATQAIQDFTKIMGELEHCLSDEPNQSPAADRLPG